MTLLVRPRAYRVRVECTNCLPGMFKCYEMVKCVSCQPSFFSDGGDVQVTALPSSSSFNTDQSNSENVSFSVPIVRQDVRVVTCD